MNSLSFLRANSLCLQLNRESAGRTLFKNRVSFGPANPKYW